MGYSFTNVQLRLLAQNAPLRCALSERAIIPLARRNNAGYSFTRNMVGLVGGLALVGGLVLVCMGWIKN